MSYRYIYFLFFLCLSIPSIEAQDIKRSQFNVELQFRKLLSNDHLGVNLGYILNERHQLRYGVYYLLQDAVFCDNNEILVRTFRPEQLYQHFGWSLGYYYKLFTFKNKSYLSIGLDIQQMRSRTHARAVIPFLGTGFFIEREIKPWMSLMEAHLIVRSEFPIYKRASFTFQAGLGGLFQPDLSPPTNFANQFVPYWAPHFQGISYHLAFGINFNLNKK